MDVHLEVESLKLQLNSWQHLILLDSFWTWNDKWLNGHGTEILKLTRLLQFATHDSLRCFELERSSESQLDSCNSQEVGNSSDPTKAQIHFGSLPPENLGSLPAENLGRPNQCSSIWKREAARFWWLFSAQRTCRESIRISAHCQANRSSSYELEEKPSIVQREALGDIQEGDNQKGWVPWEGLVWKDMVMMDLESDM